MPTKAVHMISTVHIDHYCSSVCNRLDALILWSCRQTGYAPFIDHPPPLRAWNQWQRNEKSTCLGFQLEDNAKQRSWGISLAIIRRWQLIPIEVGVQVVRHVPDFSTIQTPCVHWTPCATRQISAVITVLSNCTGTNTIMTNLLNLTLYSIAARGLPLVHAFRMVKIRSMKQKYVTWQVVLVQRWLLFCTRKTSGMSFFA